MSWEPKSIRLGVGWASKMWCDTDAIESRHESPAPVRLDAVEMNIDGTTVIDWERPEFKQAMADDVEPSGSGRRRRGRKMRIREVRQAIIADIPANSIAFFAVRPRAIGRRLQRFSAALDGAPAVLDVYEIGQLSNAVYRHWRVTGPVLDSDDDLDRDPSPQRKLKQELIVLRFDRADIVEIADEESKRGGKRPVSRDAA